MIFLEQHGWRGCKMRLNAVELAVLTTPRAEDGKIHLTLSVAEECIQKRVIRYDKSGDNHYDIISAFIKSMRGSDPDAAVYYLAKMLYAGEDVKFIARIIMISCITSIGNAHPQDFFQVASSRSAGGGASGNAGISNYSLSGGYIYGLCSKEQFCCKCHFCSYEFCEKTKHNRAVTSSGCTLWRSR